uniref:Uncharacterized protein n=1 Tax=Panagrolaimus sp. ES5 TaxID=591445 RepID=A0AC34FX43_9BILA
MLQCIIKEQKAKNQKSSKSDGIVRKGGSVDTALQFAMNFLNLKDIVVLNANWEEVELILKKSPIIASMFVEPGEIKGEENIWAYGVRRGTNSNHSLIISGKTTLEDREYFVCRNSWKKNSIFHVPVEEVMKKEKNCLNLTAEPFFYLKDFVAGATKSPLGSPSETFTTFDFDRAEKRGGQYEISKKSVYQMAFPKGTCVLRFADLNSENITDTIWLIENHILIRKLELEGPIAGGKPTFFRFTNRYQGWFYDEPWDFMPLTSVSNTSSKSVDGALTILFPTVEMIEKGYEIAQRQRLQQRISHSSEMSAREQLEQKVQQLKAIKSRRKKGKKSKNNNNDNVNDNDNDEGEEEEENAGGGGNEMMEEEDEEDGCSIDEEASSLSPPGMLMNEMFDDDD